MSIPSPLSDYLAQRGTHYEVFPHEHSRCSAETARRAHVASDQIAKSVVLEDDAGCMVAVVPANKTVMIGQLAQLVGRSRLHLADEARIAALFDGCERGAVPPVGMAWGLPTVVDDELETKPIVYLEAGDHTQLLRLTRDQFHALMDGQPHGRFCHVPTH